MRTDYYKYRIVYSEFRHDKMTGSTVSKTDQCNTVYDESYEVCCAINELQLETLLLLAKKDDLAISLSLEIYMCHYFPTGNFDHYPHSVKLIRAGLIRYEDGKNECWKYTNLYGSTDRELML